LRWYALVPWLRGYLKRTFPFDILGFVLAHVSGTWIARPASRAQQSRETIMPHATLNGAKLWYEESGQGPETIVLGHGLAFSGAMFDAQVAALRERYRCITFDLRGHGRSELSATGYDMDTLAGDLAALIEEVARVPVHFVGWSIGGFTGLRVALRRPELLRSLTLIGSSAIGGAESTLAFRLMKKMFSDRFRNDPSHAALVEKWRQHFLSDERLGVSRAARAVIARRSVERELPALLLPVLMLRGEADALVSAAAAARTIEKIPGGKFITIAGAGHACNIEEPSAVNAALASFFADASLQSPDGLSGPQLASPIRGSVV
jgi:3-oxoadipate enol-lactonase